MKVMVVVLLALVIGGCIPRYQIKLTCEAMETVHPRPEPNVKCGAKFEVIILRGGYTPLVQELTSTSTN